MSIFGEISWDQDIAGDDKKNNKDLFLRLEEGSNELRLITNPYQYITHKYKKEPNNPKDFGVKVSCSMMHGSCPLCAANDKPKARWLLGVIERKKGTYKVLDISYAVYQQIRKLARNPKWGDPQKYDVDIVVDKNGGATGYYTVQPLSKEPLSAQDQFIKDNADLDDLVRRVTPLTPEQVNTRIERITGGTLSVGISTQPQQKKVIQTKQQVSMMEDEDE